MSTAQTRGGTRVTGEKIRVTTGEGRGWIAASDVISRIPHLHFLRFYDAAHPGDPNRIEPQDWGIPALLGAPVPNKVLQAVTPEYLSACDAALVSVSPQWSLMDDVAATEYRLVVKTLLEELTAPTGIAKAIATKIVHKKRPNLIPVVDSVIARVYKLRSPTDLIFGPFRDDLIANHGALQPIKESAASVSGRDISVVRALELSIWLTSVEAGSYRAAMRPLG